MKLKLIFGLLGFMLLAGCEKATYLESDVKEIVVPVSGCIDTVILKSDVNKFKLKSAPDWVVATLNDSILTILVEKNTVQVERLGEVMIVNGDLSLVIPVKQRFKATHLDLPEGNELTINKEGGTVTLPIDCDGIVEVEAFEGVEVKCQDGLISVTAPENKDETIRGTIKLTSGDFVNEIKVVIKGELCDVCGGTGKMKCKTCKGSGVVSRFNGAFMTGSPCPTCGGPFGANGKVKCTECKGSGKNA